MVDINLLPWRDYVRENKRTDKILFGISSFLFLLFLCVSLQIVVIPKMHEKNSINLPAISSVRDSDDALNKLKFVGYLHQNNNTWGLLQLPSGELRDVRVGDSVGIANAIVKQVEPKRMVLQFPDKSERIYKDGP